MAILTKGRYSSIGRALDCDSKSWRFESFYLPKIRFFNLCKNNSFLKINFFNFYLKKYFKNYSFNFNFSKLNFLIFTFFNFLWRINLCFNFFYSILLISNKKHNSNFKLNYFSQNFSFFKSSKYFKKNILNKVTSEKLDLNLKVDLKTSKLFIIFFLKLLNKNIFNLKTKKTLIYLKNIFYDFFNFFFFFLKSSLNSISLNFFFFKINSLNFFTFKKKKSISKRLKKKYLFLNSVV